MPISGCVPCRHFFLLDPNSATGRRCSRCDQPLRLLEPGEFHTLIARLRTGSAEPARDSGGRGRR
jgi:hypothetical protein